MLERNNRQREIVNEANGYEPLNRGDILLYITIVIAWTFSWLPLKYQIGIVEPPISVFYRFALAAVIMMGIAYFKSSPLKFSLKMHLRFAALGICIFSTNFMLFYYAGMHIVSGLLAVVFATATVINIINARIFLGIISGKRTLLGVAIGLFGLVIVFLPDIRHELYEVTDGETVKGVGLAVLGTFCFSLGNMISLSLKKQGISVLSSSSWGMVYGALFMAFIGILTGAPFIFDTSWSYIASLSYLVVMASIVAFLSYLSLLRRIEPQRAAYATVIFPIGALIVSYFVENFSASYEVILGAILVLIGNLLVLSRK